MKRNLILALILISSVISSVSCGDLNTAKTENGQASEFRESLAETTAEAYFLPDGLDYGGAKYTILYGQSISDLGENEVDYETGDFEVGDIIAEAVYNRTCKAEEKLKVSISSYQIAWSDLQSTIKKTVLAGSGDYDAICGRLSILATAMTSGYLHNLKSIESLDLSHDWWDQSVNESMSFGSRQYIASGDINYYDDYSILIMCFNKKLFIDNGFEAPYQIVRDGKWTFDKFYTYIKDGAQDINGDGKFDDKDKYGIVVNTGNLSAALVGFDEEFTAVDDTGAIVFNTSEDIVSKAQNYTDKMMNNDAVLVEERKLGYEKGDLIFPNGQALFTQALVGSIVSFRWSMEDDFGIVPFPKYDESQSDYHSITSQHWASAYSVPVTCSDFKMTGYILDTMGYYSPDTVTEAVIENNILTKTSRDEDSSEMLKLIFKSKVFERSIVMNWGIYDVWCNLCQSTSPEIASTLEKNSTKLNTTILKSIEIINNLT